MQINIVVLKNRNFIDFVGKPRVQNTYIASKTKLKTKVFKQTNKKWKLHLWAGKLNSQKTPSYLHTFSSRWLGHFFNLNEGVRIKLCVLFFSYFITSICGCLQQFFSYNDWVTIQKPSICIVADIHGGGHIDYAPLRVLVYSRYNWKCCERYWKLRPFSAQNQ